MLKKEELELFLGKHIAIGVPHIVDSDRLFYYYGTLIYVDYRQIKLETKNGFKLVPIDLIQDIHKDGRKR